MLDYEHKINSSDIYNRYNSFNSPKRLKINTRKYRIYTVYIQYIMHAESKINQNAHQPCRGNITSKINR